MANTKQKKGADEREERPKPERLLNLGNGLAIWRVHVDDLREQEVNARAQTPQMFDRLSSTIGRDRRLESLPFCALTGDPNDSDPSIEIVSGHHRIRASRTAQVFVVHVIADETGLSRDQIAAKQLAHNAIEGTDEQQLVARIYQQIRDVDARLEAFVAHQPGIETIPEPVSLPKLDLVVDYRTVLITFLPHQADLFNRAVDQLATQVDLDRDHLYLADRFLYDLWQAAMKRLKKEYDARAVSTVIARMVDAVADVLGIDGRNPEDLDPQAHIALAELFGSAVVAPDLADMISSVVDAAVKNGQATRSTRIRVLEQAIRDYAEHHHIRLPEAAQT